MVVVALALAALPAAVGLGLEAAGNVDGVLLWPLGDLGAGQTAREVVFLAFDADLGATASRLDAARRAFADPAVLPAPVGLQSDTQPTWIDNGTTDFAMETPGLFRWRMVQQALRCDRGGQLSQFTFYVHYTDAAGRHHAGIPNDGDSTPENLIVTRPLRKLSDTALAGALRTADGALAIEVRATAGEGPLVAVEFVVTPVSPVSDVDLGIYANVECNHDEANDYAFLDQATGGLLVLDPVTGRCVLVAGLHSPTKGWAGVWNSISAARNDEGIAFAEWKPFAGVTPELAKQFAREQAAAQGYYLPYHHENPQTPETRRLTPEEGDAALVRDWLFQAQGEPLAERARKEIGWAQQLSRRLSPDGQNVGVQAGMNRLAVLERRLMALVAEGYDDAGARELYLDVRRAKRAIALANPALDFDQLLFIDQPYPSGPVNDIHEAIHRMGITATPGGRLLVLTGLDPGGEVRQLAPETPGSFWRPDLSFDGTRVLFCYKAGNAKSFHLYEMNLDGSGLRQLTDSDYDDIDPLYLPDGHILFTSTRGNSYVRCGPFIYSYILARCDADGRNVYLISCNGEPDFVPALLPDGRVAYSRWEYSDKPLWRVQSLWATNQDGTGTAVLWGNQSVWPDHTAQPRPIPGTPRIMFVGVGHHDWWSGSVGIIDPTRGTNFPAGLTKVTVDRPWPECSTPPLDPPESPTYHASGNFTGYQSPYPLTAQDFLVSARSAEDGKFRLYLMDTEGNRELIYEGVSNVLHAIPIKPRPAPPVQPDRVIWPGTGADRQTPELGACYSSNVYQGVPDLAPGSVKYLRVLQLDHKTYSTWAKTFRHSGPPVSVIQEEGVKRVLSIVPVDSDGSAYFKAPPGKSLYFQLLDADYRCLQTMRSFAGLMPGEVRGCVGCHESHSTAPPTRTGLAVRRAPTELAPPEWGTESVSYERFAQPVLDRYCGSCHQGEGKARKALDLTLRPGYSVFKEPYLTLVGSAGWGNPVGDQKQPGYGIAGAIPVETMDPTMNSPKALRTLRPGQYLSGSSPLIRMAMSGEHHGVVVDPLSLHRLITWVDACCPFMGEPELRALGDPDFPGIEELPIRPRVATAPVVERP
jgi:hypothetical protein